MKFTKAHATQARKIARIETGLRKVYLAAGERYNIDKGTDDTNINIAMLTNDPGWEDTDLYDNSTYLEELIGKEIEEKDGKVLIDFYIYSDKTECGSYVDLESNVDLTWMNGKIVAAYGTEQGAIDLKLIS
jgi:hypothetical protein